MADQEDLIDYEEDEVQQEQPAAAPAASNGAANGDAKTKGSYASVHSSGFRDFLLKRESPLLFTIRYSSSSRTSSCNHRFWIRTSIRGYARDTFQVINLIHQSSKNVFHSPSSVWTCFARQSPVWERLLYLSLQHCSNWNQ